MKQNIRLTCSAVSDLDEIWFYIAIENHSPAAADNLIDEVDRHFQLLVTQPMMGESVSKLRAGTR